MDGLFDAPRLLHRVLDLGNLRQGILQRLPDLLDGYIPFASLLNRLTGAFRHLRRFLDVVHHVV
ncbi:hypothetical protein NVS55_24340 [Myxococcus stipitatus]|uniref:hypothetical protein n=1 Tax=Myxococcus stipitatus TaxID=83455 RepID=UPI00314568D8